MRAGSHRLIVIDRASVAHCHHEHSQATLLKLADDSIVSQAVAPQSKLTAAKGLPKVPRTRGLAYAVFHVVKDFLLDGAVESSKVLQDSTVVFNGPGQALFALDGLLRLADGSRDAAPPDSDLRDPRYCSRSAPGRTRSSCVRRAWPARKGVDRCQDSSGLRACEYATSIENGVRKAQTEIMFRPGPPSSRGVTVLNLGIRLEIRPGDCHSREGGNLLAADCN